MLVVKKGASKDSFARCMGKLCASEAQRKTSTNAFIAIGELLSEQCSSLHDRKSFLLGFILDCHPLRLTREEQGLPMY